MLSKKSILKLFNITEDLQEEEYNKRYVFLLKLMQSSGIDDVSLEGISDFNNEHKPNWENLYQLHVERDKLLKIDCMFKHGYIMIERNEGKFKIVHGTWEYEYGDWKTI
jgi:hypothetical protein